MEGELFTVWEDKRQGDNNLELFKDRSLGFSMGKDNLMEDTYRQTHTLEVVITTTAEQESLGLAIASVMTLFVLKVKAGSC